MRNRQKDYAETYSAWEMRKLPTSASHSSIKPYTCCTSCW